MIGLDRREDMVNKAFSTGVDHGRTLKNEQYWEGLAEGRAKETEIANKHYEAGFLEGKEEGRQTVLKEMGKIVFNAERGFRS